jgi:hypothetical protein
LIEETTQEVQKVVPILFTRKLEEDAFKQEDGSKSPKKKEVALGKMQRMMD